MAAAGAQPPDRRRDAVSCGEEGCCQVQGGDWTFLLRLGLAAVGVGARCDAAGGVAARWRRRVCRRRSGLDRPACARPPPAPRPPSQTPAALGGGGGRWAARSPARARARTRHAPTDANRSPNCPSWRGVRQARGRAPTAARREERAGACLCSGCQAPACYQRGRSGRSNAIKRHGRQGKRQVAVWRQSSRVRPAELNAAAAPQHGAKGAVPVGQERARCARPPHRTPPASAPRAAPPTARPPSRAVRARSGPRARAASGARGAAAARPPVAPSMSWDHTSTKSRLVSARAAGDARKGASSGTPSANQSPEMASARSRGACAPLASARSARPEVCDQCVVI